MAPICTGAVRVEEKEEKGVDAVKRSIVENWRLEDIRDLFLGTRNFRKTAGVSVPHDSLCMSVVLRDKAELNLEAQSKAQRDLMFYSLVSVLKHGPKLDEDDEGEEEAVADAAPAVVVPKMEAAPSDIVISAPQPVASAESVRPVVSSQVVEMKTAPPPPSATSGSSTPVQSSNIVADGLEMSVWSGNETHSTATRQFVYWDAPEPKRRLGTLRWCPPGQRVKVEGQELPLHHISDVFMGRNSVALKSPEAVAQATPSHCFVLFSKSLTFSAECSSDKEREQWLKSFKRMFTAQGKAVIDQKKRSSTGASAQATPPTSST